MTDEIRRALCKHNKDNPSLTQKQLQEGVHSNYGLQVSQATISNTVKRSLEYLSLAPERGDVRDEIQGEIDFNKKQKTIESFFKKPS
ncbi:hypothetical protein Tco_0479615 [Tanacetum coccineum]